MEQEETARKPFAPTANTASAKAPLMADGKRALCPRIWLHTMSHLSCMRGAERLPEKKRHFHHQMYHSMVLPGCQAFALEMRKFRWRWREMQAGRKSSANFANGVRAAPTTVPTPTRLKQAQGRPARLRWVDFNAACIAQYHNVLSFHCERGPG